MAPSVKQVASLLDERHPGWENKIDCDQLDLKNTRKCIIGQLNRDNFLSIIKNGNKDRDIMFSYVCLTNQFKEEWIREIFKRKEVKAMEIGKPQREIEVTPLEEPVPHHIDIPEPAQEPAHVPEEVPEKVPA